MERTWTALLIGAALLASARPASADAACRTTADSSNAVLHIDGLTLSNGDLEVRYFIGNFNFFGFSTVGVCVERQAIPASQTLHAILDSNNNLLAYLPKAYNHLCLSSKVDIVEVVVGNETHCGTAMTPLNYAGNRFVLYGRDNPDEVSGGNGIDIIYGGLGHDTLKDFSYEDGDNSIYAGTLLGESDGDALYGSLASATYLEGGAGVDGIGDIGGTGDKLLGGAGNDCCMADSNEQWSQFDCGTGTDTVNDRTGKLNCENNDSACTPGHLENACNGSWN